ncbi:hypothetical protein [Leptospira santarosai]|nr:hypothetical protein [Leptospira santarosai]MDI7183631.1 hypothetical protein [Leptospira santarosai]MDO6383377.1 hypothetical protein [Leptospira santarosai]
MISHDNQMNDLRNLVDRDPQVRIQRTKGFSPEEISSVADWIATEHARRNVRQSRRRIREAFKSYRNERTYLKQQIKERDALLLTLKAETDAMAAVIKDIKKSYGIRVVA